MKHMSGCRHTATAIVCGTAYRHQGSNPSNQLAHRFVIGPYVESLREINKAADDLTA